MSQVLLLMETRSQTHPTERQLAAYALGKLTPDGRAQLERHLSDCESCATFLSGTPRDTFIALLRQAAVQIPASEQSTPDVRNSRTLNNMLTSGHADDARLPVAPAAPPTPSAVHTARSRPDDLSPALREQTKYRIGQLLGRGGMGSVYEAFHERMGRRVAIKVINPALVENPEAIKRFDQEVRAAAQVEHDNVARAYDAEEIGNLRILVMEFVSGQSLDKYVVSRGPLPVSLACRFIQQALAGLNDAHKRGMVHRDLKPQNLMVTTEGKIKILDFGLAKLASEHRGADGLTRENALMGTPHYLAPEQALDAGKADIRADIYSLGCTLYFLLAGRTPFTGDTEMKVLLAHQHDVHRPLSEIRSDIPPALSRLVDRMLAKNPADRPQTPIEAGQALTPFLKAQPAALLATPPATSAAPVTGKSGTATPLETIEVPIGDDASADRAARASGTATASTPRTKDLVARLWNRWRWLMLVVGAFFFVVLTYGLVVLLRTPTGTIVLHNVPADAQVVVDGNTIALNGKDESLTIAGVERGEHHIKLVRDARTIWANDLAISFGGETVEVTYSPFVSPPIENVQKASPATKTVDLLRLVSLTEGDALRGRWDEVVDGLHSRENSMLRLPYRPPAEYDFAIEFTIHRIESGGDVNLCCPVGDTGFTLMMGRDGNANTGFYGVSHAYDPPTRHARPTFETGKRHRAIVSVRHDVITAELDNNGPLRLKAPESAMRFEIGWHAGVGVLGVGSLNDITFHKIECTPVSEPGHIIERLTKAKAADNAAAFRALSIGGRKFLTDFMPRARRVGYAEFAYNANNDGSPALVDGKPCKRYIFAHAPSSAVYDIPPGAIGFSAVGVGLHKVDRSKQGHWRYIVDVDGDEAFVSSSVGIDKGKVEIQVPLPRDAKRLELRTDPLGNFANDFSIWADPEFLFADERAAATSVQLPAEVEIPKSARRVDLLALVDPRADAVVGEWERKGRNLVVPNGKKVPRIEFPYVPPQEYDLRLAFVPRSCEYVGLACVADSKQFTGFVGGWGNTVAGFEMIDNKRAGDVQPSPRAPNGWLIVGRQHELLARVRQDHAELYFDGALVSRFDGEYKRLSTFRDATLRHKEQLGIVTACGVEIRAAELFELTGAGKPTREPQRDALTATEAPEDKDSAALPEAMRNFPNANFSGGDWKIEETADAQVLLQSSTAEAGNVIWFGDPNWTAYNLTFRAKSDGGSNGFAVGWHVRGEPDHLTFRAMQFGGWGNTLHELSTFINGNVPPRNRAVAVEGHIDRSQWYDVRIEVRGAESSCYLNGTLVLAGTDDTLIPAGDSHALLTTGMIGFGHYSTAFRIKDIKITSEDDKTVLWQGLPKLPR